MKNASDLETIFSFDYTTVGMRSNLIDRRDDNRKAGSDVKSETGSDQLEYVQ